MWLPRTRRSFAAAAAPGRPLPTWATQGPARIVDRDVGIDKTPAVFGLEQIAARIGAERDAPRRRQRAAAAQAGQRVVEQEPGADQPRPTHARAMWQHEAARLRQVRRD